MIKRKAEVDPLKSYNADSGLIGYLEKRLKLSKEMDQLDAAGKEFPSEINARDKSLRTKKVRILDIIFQAMADLTFFFKTVALHPELQQILESDIKDLLGVKHQSTQEYGYMICDLLPVCIDSRRRHNQSQKGGFPIETEFGNTGNSNG